MRTRGVTPIIMEKLAKKTKEKPFDISQIFDYSFKPGKEVNMAKKEKKPQMESLSTSLRKQGRISDSYKKVMPFK